MRFDIRFDFSRTNLWVQHRGLETIDKVTSVLFPSNCTSFSYGPEKTGSEMNEVIYSRTEPSTDNNSSVPQNSASNDNPNRDDSGPSWKPVQLK